AMQSSKLIGSDCAASDSVKKFDSSITKKVLTKHFVLLRRINDSLFIFFDIVGTSLLGDSVTWRLGDLTSLDASMFVNVFGIIDTSLLCDFVTLRLCDIIILAFIIFNF
ncbi:MAG: hypothetical protein IKM23_08360, partial [Bacteroidales bacterium]|nr:hypothetical protein [Bacteroidales bacterium]